MKTLYLNFTQHWIWRIYGHSFYGGPREYWNQHNPSKKIYTIKIDRINNNGCAKKTLSKLYANHKCHKTCMPISIIDVSLQIQKKNFNFNDYHTLARNTSTLSKYWDQVRKWNKTKTGSKIKSSKATENV